MSADVDGSQLRRVLNELGYEMPFDSHSAPLINQLLLDLMDTSKECSELTEAVQLLYDNHASSASAVPKVGLFGVDFPSSAIDDTFVINTVENANSKLTELKDDLSQAKQENKQLRLMLENTQGDLSSISKQTDIRQTLQKYLGSLADGEWEPVLRQKLDELLRLQQENKGRRFYYILQTLRLGQYLWKRAKRILTPAWRNCSVALVNIKPKYNT